jgi:NAD(P)-dependent dehydrogenase (short-subunit alcohol dehydrogenase family)
MKVFKDKIAVITGAGSGIGFAIAERCAQEGMKVVLADISERFLKRANRKMEKLGATFLTSRTDVSKLEDMEALANKTIENFGAVHLLVNNAGVSNTKYFWNYTLNDWKWQIGVNLWGVIHGLHIFVPIMRKQDTECHIVNTASIEGLLAGSGPGGAIYGLTKHAIVSLSESMRTELTQTKSKIKVSVLCPGWVSTKIFFSDAHRQDEYRDSLEDTFDEEKIQDSQSKFQAIRDLSPPMACEDVAEIVIKAIRRKKFYILTHTDQILKDGLQLRYGEILRAFGK